MRGANARRTATVREVTYDLLGAYGLTTIFGNVGSTEQPFLADFPSDFRYVLGLQETSVVAMADGFAQATRSRESLDEGCPNGPGDPHLQGGPSADLVRTWGVLLDSAQGQQRRALGSSDACQARDVQALVAAIAAQAA
jgi:thiamine pyrophosphate-dependent enzyme